jgi:hypothetical protein
MAAIGMPLDPWQRTTLEAWLGVSSGRVVGGDVCGGAGKQAEREKRNS